MHHLLSKRPVEEGILILDYGSQYTLLIARRLRELGIYAEIIDGTAEKAPDDFNFHGLILSGGPDSANDSVARALPSWVLDSNKPVLGICYGMQLLAYTLGGQLRSGSNRTYGKATLELTADHGIDWLDAFKDIEVNQTVWMSHGDDVAELPEQMKVIGRTDSGVLAAIAHQAKPLIGLQFHPEVQHSEYGDQLLDAFASKVCGAPRNWKADDVLEATSQFLKETVGDGKVLMAVSGGVDSTVAVVLMSQALGKEKVQAVFVDHGLLRKDEALWVEKNLKDFGVNIELLDRKESFYAALKDVSDPEEKRKVIGRKFIEEFESFAKAHQGDAFTHLGQGTLYPDVIESAGHGAGSKVIKSHHNVGGLPEKLHLQLAEPFRFLFKDEVRVLGRKLGIPDSLVGRHPFPGPGLAVRIIGSISPDKVAILQEADAIFIRRLQEAGLYDEVWQAFAVLLPVKTVGVMGDNRSYQWTCALRAVTASDGMTAGVGDLPMSFLVSVSDEIVRKVDGINRVVYDVTTKPPATIEWE